jgi:peptidoglycan/xylan/chitin deacetylase (PgdA/CDA1 family)
MAVRQRLTYAVKVALAHALYYTGVLRIWQAIVLRRKAVVLMYHRVLSDEERQATCSHPGIVVSKATFEAQMAFLKRRFVVLSVDQFANRLDNRAPFLDSSCLITFDDGWRDNFEHALPALARHGLPAIVFLPVNYIGRDCPFWQEALTHLVWRAVEEVTSNPGRRDRLLDLVSPLGLQGLLQLGDLHGRASICEAVRTIKQEGRSLIGQVLLDLSAELGIDLAEISRTDGFMTWDQVGEMSRHGVALGGHGAEHHLLTQIPSTDAAADILTSKQVLDARLSQRARAFAYPNGDWNPEVATAVRMSGFDLAFTTRRGFVTCDDDRFAIRRVNVHDDMTRTMPMFLARVTGIL